MSYPVTIKLLESDKQIAKQMMLEIVKELNKRIPSHMNTIDKKLRVATYKYLKTSKTYESLISGDLAAHFGIPIAHRETNINAIIQAVADRMEVEYTPVKYSVSKFTNGIKIKVLMKDLSEVLSLYQGVVGTEDGEVLEWLRWLLTKGDSIIIKEYDVQLMVGKGRSGGGIMIYDQAEVWRVPPEYSGTMRDNWLTRTLNENSTAYLSIIEKIIKYELQRI